MSTSPAFLLTLLVNGLLPFAFALGFVGAIIKLCRIPPGRIRLGFLLLPFARLAWELGRGVPASSFFWAHHVIERETTSVLLGIGVRHPLCLVLNAFMKGNAHGFAVPLSLGDVLVHGCDRLRPWCVTVLVAVVLAISVGRLALRVGRDLRFELERRRGRVAATAAWKERLGWREVDVYLDARASLGAVPFAGGLLRPYVCFPAATHEALLPAERRAALLHELAHVGEWHVPLLVGARLFADLCWFVPGTRWLTRRLAAECELVADDRALREGAGQLELASAMVRTLELGGSRPVSAPTSALLMPTSPGRARARIARLVAPPSLAAKWRTAVATGLRLLVLALTAQTVLTAMMFSNF